jgi:tRNA modification GTPase
MIKKDLIVAMATPQGMAGVAIIRISGENVQKLFLRLIGVDKLTPRVATVIKVYDHDQHVIDQGLALYFQAPHSFTGESVLEIHGHGGHIVPNQIVDRCIAIGCRMAEPGEFSLRALYNQKMDLIQAESIHELITAQTKAQAKAAMRSMQGDFSKEIIDIQSKLTSVRVHLEAIIDFSDEDISPSSEQHQQIRQIILEIEKTTLKAEESNEFHRKKTAVFVGSPNVGKSSWFNRIVGEDAAIVTEKAGTTRDLIRQSIIIDSQEVQFIDSAGIRDTDDSIEKEGVRRTESAIQSADIILWVVSKDNVQNLDAQWRELFDFDFDPKSTLVIINKVDEPITDTRIQTSWKKEPLLFVSSLKIADREQIMRRLKDKITKSSPPEFLARERHIVSLKEAHKALKEALNRLDENALVLAAEDLRVSQCALDNLLGTFSNEDLLGEIF